LKTTFTLNSKFEAVTVDIPPKLVAEASKPTAVSHIIIIDCSGSMTGNLPDLRNHLKNKVAKMMREDDTLSIVWFSGRGQYGTILENTSVPNLRELQEVHQAIDRWLRPVGATGFVEPIRELTRLIKNLSKNGKAINAFFLSDGGENCWPRNDVFKAIAESTNGLATATVVEYGYWADRAFLAEMAARWGGAHIFAPEFTSYQPLIEAALTRQVVGGPKVTVEVGNAEGDIAVAIVQGEVVAYAVENGKVSVPEGTSQVSFVQPASKKAADALPKHTDFLYALTSAFAPRVRSDVIWPILKKLGDTKLIKAYANCFGKQAYSEFQALATAAATDRAQQLAEGYDPTMVPVEDAYTILDLLSDLSNTNARVDFDHKLFSYARIGRERVDANTRLTDAEQASLKDLTDELAKTKDIAKSKEIQEKINALTNKPAPLVFKADEKPELERGYEIHGLTTNEERPNISFLVQRFGTVDLTDRLTKEPTLSEVIPAQFPTYTYRNYTVIRDGIINVKVLPVVNLNSSMETDLELKVSQGKLNRSAFSKVTEDAKTTWLFDLTQIPIINQVMVKRVSAKELFELEWEKTKAQAKAKVIKDAYNELFDKKSAGFAALYGDNGGKWLSDQGIVSYSGFSPSSLQTESTDFYMAKELKLKLKGYSALPSVAALRKQIEAKKPLNGPMSLMKPWLDEVDKRKADVDKFKEWAEKEKDAAIKKARQIQFKLARAVYSIIVGQTWFTEFNDLSQNSLDLTLDGLKLSFTAELKEVETKI